MRRFKKILVATDFSEICDNAIDHAVALAKDQHAELHLLHVQILNTGMIAATMYDSENELHRTLGEELQRVASRLDVDPVCKVVRDVQAAPAIMDYARENDIGLVVVSTHARRNVQRLFMGSVAAEVLRISSRPVLVVGAHHRRPESGYNRIMLPVDLTEDSEMIKRRALALMPEDDQNLIFQLIHVFETDHFRYVYSDLKSENHRAAETRLTQLVNELQLPGYVYYSSPVGAEDEQIAGQAREEGFDLIVMGRASISRMGRLLLGSTTDRVIRQAPCPVLAWRDQRDQAEEDDAI